MKPGDMIVPKVLADPSYHVSSGIILWVERDWNNPSLVKVLWSDGKITNILKNILIYSWHVTNAKLQTEGALWAEGHPVGWDER